MLAFLSFVFWTEERLIHTEINSETENADCRRADGVRGVAGDARGNAGKVRIEFLSAPFLFLFCILMWVFATLRFLFVCCAFKLFGSTNVWPFSRISVADLPFCFSFGILCVYSTFWTTMGEYTFTLHDFQKKNTNRVLTCRFDPLRSTRSPTNGFSRVGSWRLYWLQSVRGLKRLKPRFSRNLRLIMETEV